MGFVLIIVLLFFLYLLVRHNYRMGATQGTYVTLAALIKTLQSKDLTLAEIEEFLRVLNTKVTEVTDDDVNKLRGKNR